MFTLLWFIKVKKLVMKHFVFYLRKKVEMIYAFPIGLEVKQDLIVIIFLIKL